METRKTYKSFHFKNSILWQSARRGSMTNSGHRAVEIGSPPEFKGTSDVWCPEELLIGAVNACLMLTFLTFAQRRQLEISAYESSAEGSIENTDGKYRVTNIKVQPVVSLGRENNIPLAQDVFKDAKEACIISNSVIAKVDLVPQFNIQTGHTAEESA